LSFVRDVYSGPWPPREVWSGKNGATRYWLYGPWCLERHADSATASRDEQQ
jgi:hypothetical protein